MIGVVTGTRAVKAAAAVTLVLGVAACSSDDPEPRVAPPTSSAPSSASTSPIAAAAKPTAVVRNWVDAQNAALATGDTSALRALSAETCRGCADFVRPIEQVYRRGGHFSTRGWRVAAAEARDGSSDPIVVDVGVAIAGGTTVPAAGADPVHYGPQKRIMLFKLVHRATGLAVSFVGFVQ